MRFAFVPTQLELAVHFAKLKHCKIAYDLAVYTPPAFRLALTLIPAAFRFRSILFSMFKREIFWWESWAILRCTIATCLCSAQQSRRRTIFVAIDVAVTTSTQNGTVKFTAFAVFSLLCLQVRLRFVCCQLGYFPLRGACLTCPRWIDWTKRVLN